MPLPARHASPQAVSLAASLTALDGVHVALDEPLSRHTSMGVGGPARWFVRVDRLPALAPVLDALRRAEAPWLILGGGSNVLFDDEGFHGAVLVLGADFRSIHRPGPEPALRAGAAAPLGAIMNFAKRQGLAGAEFFAGIPGVLGGALAGNAGAADSDACGLALSVDLLDPDGSVRTLRRGEFAFAYRWSQLAGQVILAATLGLRPDSPEAIDRRIREHLAKRLEQPLGERSSGCMFKNPTGQFAGRLIDQCGLKGLRVGGVFVSPQHANFMINDGSASSADVRRLMNLVRDRVRAACGVDLEAEVRSIPASIPPR